CPEIFELPVDGSESDTRWIVFAADAQYAIGAFDGKAFTPEHEGKHRLHYGNYYASQTFSNNPDGRRIQIGWAQIEMPDMPFNQTFSFPHQLSLRSTEDGIRMFAEPIKEIETLYRKTHTAQDQPLSQPVELPVSGELFDIRATLAIGEAITLVLHIGGEHITYDVQANQLNGVEMKPVDGEISLQILVDRPMLEIIGNNGRVFITTKRHAPSVVEMVTVSAVGGPAKLLHLEVNELRSIW
ncbi:MAG: GH32 C-terminal domain-containing protein, partial [Candidatus Poribacteria bacterium]|nr:GH32 C-terminal domain-containing protein [Candidatus Poribacteria bacterium]